MLEQRLDKTENDNNLLNNDRGQLKKELDSVMFELGKAKMSSAIQDEEQEACTMALKGEIKFLINKLLKAKGKFNDNSRQNSQISDISNNS